MSEEWIGLAAVVCIFSVPIIWIICHHIFKSIESWQQIALKRDMVARGYTAQEIMAVVGEESDSARKTALPDVPPAKPMKQAAPL